MAERRHFDLVLIGAIHERFIERRMRSAVENDPSVLRKVAYLDLLSVGQGMVVGHEDVERCLGQFDSGKTRRHFRVRDKRKVETPR